MGDALLQKTYTVDVLTKKRVSNNGIVPQYYVENNHEAIIPRQLFMQVQEELFRLKLKTERPRESTVASTHYRVLSTVASVEIFSEEWLGRPEVHHTTNGDVPVELRRVRKKAVTPMPPVKQRFRTQW